MAHLSYCTSGFPWLRPAPARELCAHFDLRRRDEQGNIMLNQRRGQTDIIGMQLDQGGGLGRKQKTENSYALHHELDAQAQQKVCSLSFLRLYFSLFISLTPTPIHLPMSCVEPNPEFSPTQRLAEQQHRQHELESEKAHVQQAAAWQGRAGAGAPRRAANGEVHGRYALDKEMHFEEIADTAKAIPKEVCLPSSIRWCIIDASLCQSVLFPPCVNLTIEGALEVRR